MTWDLAEVIAERKQPRVDVTVYLNEYASHAKVQIERALSTETDATVVAELETKLAETEQALTDSKYVITLEALPARMREDINSKALHEYPVRRGVLGGLAPEDPTKERIEFENNTLFAAMVREVTNPRGDVKAEWTREEAVQFLQALPSGAQASVDRAIKQIHEDAEKFTAEVANPKA